jgi:hypothetical protein
VKHYLSPEVTPDIFLFTQASFVKIPANPWAKSDIFDILYLYILSIIDQEEQMAHLEKKKKGKKPWPLISASAISSPHLPAS